MSQFTGLNATAGAGLIGVFISTGMYGWTTLQTTHYFDSSWSKDSRWMKAYIAFIWACQTAHTYLLCASVYHAVITDIVLGDAAGWEVTRKQDDFLHTPHMDRGCNFALTTALTLLAIGHFALELLVVLLTMQYPDFAQFHNITAYYTGSLAVAALDDLMIAAALCYFLYTQRTGLKGADTLIKRVIRYSIMTGAVTSIVDVIILICFIAMPDNLVYLTLYNFLPNLYVNSLLVMLNARESLQKLSLASAMRQDALSSTFSISDFRRRVASCDSEAGPAHEADPVTGEQTQEQPVSATGDNTPAACGIET